MAWKRHECLFRVHAPRPLKTPFLYLAIVFFVERDCQLHAAATHWCILKSIVLENLKYFLFCQNSLNLSFMLSQGLGKWWNLETFLSFDFGPGNQTRCAWRLVQVSPTVLNCHLITWQFSGPVGWYLYQSSLLILVPIVRQPRVWFPGPKSRDKNDFRYHHHFESFPDEMCVRHGMSSG